jgi:hypothetical protein
MADKHSTQVFEMVDIGALEDWLIEMHKRCTRSPKAWSSSLISSCLTDNTVTQPTPSASSKRRYLIDLRRVKNGSFDHRFMSARLEVSHFNKKPPFSNDKDKPIN